jgi:hypothetical protein
VRKNFFYLIVGLFFTTTASAQNASWADNVKFKGDLRYRYELIDKDKDQRHRNRIRARIEIQAEVNQMTNIGLQLATGSDDPVSTNQTLSNSFSTKNLMLDLAYLKIIPPFIPDLTIIGGKFNNPLFKPGKSELLWDSDLNPEGGAIAYKKSSKNASITLTEVGFWIEERSSDDDSWMAAGQWIVSYYPNEKKYSFVLGGGILNYFHTAGYEPFFDSDNPMGNTVDSSGLYANEYKLVELLAEGTRHFGNIPVMLFGDLVVNTSADSFNTGWLVGLLLGKTKKTGSWDLHYFYRKIEKDAVIGAFTDSDFLGGGTDGKGHEIGGAYQIAQNSTVEWTYFANTVGLVGEGTDYNRLQVDLQLKF